MVPTAGQTRAVTSSKVSEWWEGQQGTPPHTGKHAGQQPALAQACAPSWTCLHKRSPGQCSLTWDVRRPPGLRRLRHLPGQVGPRHAAGQRDTRRAQGLQDCCGERGLRFAVANAAASLIPSSGMHAPCQQCKSVCLLASTRVPVCLPGSNQGHPVVPPAFQTVPRPAAAAGASPVATNGPALPASLPPSCFPLLACLPSPGPAWPGPSQPCRSATRLPCGWASSTTCCGPTSGGGSTT